MLLQIACGRVGFAAKTLLLQLIFWTAWFGSAAHADLAQGTLSIPSAMRRADGAPGRSRTCDHSLRRRVLYPVELRGRTFKAM